MTRLMERLCPIFDTVGTRKMMAISVLERYWAGPCCNNPGHMPNRGRVTQEMDRMIISLADQIKSNMWNMGYRRS